MKNKTPKLDVAWHIPGKKRPIAYSTISDSDAVVEMNWPNKTPNDLLGEISKRRLVGCFEIKRILGLYVLAGQGGVTLKTRNPNGMR